MSDKKAKPNPAIRKVVSESIAWAKYHLDERELEHFIDSHHVGKQPLSLEEREAITQAWTEIQLARRHREKS